MWPNPQETADLIVFTEEILNGKLYFLCRVWILLNFVLVILLICFIIIIILFLQIVDILLRYTKIFTFNLSLNYQLFFFGLSNPNLN